MYSLYRARTQNRLLIIWLTITGRTVASWQRLLRGVCMHGWVRVVFVLAAVWLLTRWAGGGPLPVPDPRTAVLWAAVVLGVFLLWRDGRGLLIRYGFGRQDTPKAILEKRLALGEISLPAYRRLRDELDAAGIKTPNENKEAKLILRGDRK